MVCFEANAQRIYCHVESKTWSAELADELVNQYFWKIQIRLKYIRKGQISKTQADTSIDGHILDFGYVRHFHQKLVNRLQPYKFMLFIRIQYNFQQIGYNIVSYLRVIEPSKFTYFGQKQNYHFDDLIWLAQYFGGCEIL